jgi:hypothetical protein
MSEILLLNAARKRRRTKRTAKRRTLRKPSKKRPTRKRRAVKRTTRKTAAKRIAATKGASTMARRKRRKTTKRAPRRNPTRRRRATRAVTRRASGAFHGLNFRSALKNIPMNTLGMFAAKWAAKRFGDAATETDPSTWNYASYLKGAAGAAAAGFVMNMIKRGTGQRVLEGGMSLMLYKLLQNELVVNSPFWSGQLGADDDYQRVPGTVEANSEGDYYVLGEDYQWHPMDGADDYRMEPELYGDLVEPGPLGLGDALVQPGPLGLGASDVDAMYSRSFLRR